MAKVVLITGCSTGIGLKLALRLAQSQNPTYKVYATMRNLEKQKQLVQEAGSALNKTLLIRKLDVGKSDQVQSVVEEAVQNEGKIDILVNNAGFGYVCAFESMPMDIAQQMMDTNFFGCMRCMQACIPHMKKQNCGHIINLSSLSGIYGTPFHGLYASTKFAMEGLSESLAPELSYFGISISLIEPGPVATTFVDTWIDRRKDSKENKQLGQQTQKLTDGIIDFMTKRPPDVVENVDHVVDVIMKCINDKPPSLRYPTTEVVLKAAKRKFIDPTGDSVTDFTTSFYPIFKKD
ncbi:uncharacterized protein TRIADDRAFT_54240 [Trichoplax adhaerens]|uniref:Uncharacterized protein n=1 Tax=Trichoplax adhaerens TaxID=10228 RepID=B3RRH6_TRIAD|nr:hypothetical protein TRIADDRAFT_54240 [Trichoplax adhaerens]EDV26346.1 hypothetical protein TRIADDRAFT_54240 [Trichoplax adhaerens]|eukprot:XP_002110342.1 hypothetical protein TRIADDRAFT_54240 [Trichoplax adhaerens]